MGTTTVADEGLVRADQRMEVKMSAEFVTEKVGPLDKALQLVDALSVLGLFEWGAKGLAATIPNDNKLVGDSGYTGAQVHNIMAVVSAFSALMTDRSNQLRTKLYASGKPSRIGAVSADTTTEVRRG